jgi:hypothetical protein
MTAFPMFSRLPVELRLHIWELTVEPRTVEVRVFGSHTIHIDYTKKREPYPRLFSSTPAPATLHTCREARDHLQKNYQQAFADLAIINGAPRDTERKYIWTNLDIDTISIDDTRFECFESVAPIIQRLKFARDDNCESWSRWESDKMRWFANVQEIYVDIGDHDFPHWHGTSEQYYWPCGVENVYMITPRDGQMMNLVDLENKYDRLWEKEIEKEHGRYVQVINGDPQWPEDMF